MYNITSEREEQRDKGEGAYLDYLEFLDLCVDDEDDKLLYASLGKSLDTKISIHLAQGTFLWRRGGDALKQARKLAIFWKSAPTGSTYDGQVTKVKKGRFTKAEAERVKRSKKFPKSRAEHSPNKEDDWESYRFTILPSIPFFSTRKNTIPSMAETLKTVLRYNSERL